MAHGANDHPPTPANDDDVFRAVEMTLFRLLRSRRKLLECDVSILPPDQQRRRSDALQEADTLLGQVITYLESQPGWFRHKL